MATVNEIFCAYQNCLLQSCQFLNHNGFAVGYRGIVHRIDSKDNQKLILCLTEPLYFREWPYRPTSKRSERIDILAEIIETVRLTDARCTHTTLRLNYFSCDGDTRIASDAIHYDFDSDVQNQHPVCHAQGVNQILEKRPEEFPAAVDISPIARRHQTIRIPSAFVNFAGLFAKLTADHLPAHVVAEFWEKCRSCVDAIPDHLATDVSNRVITAATLRSYSWYKW
jgi:hypothetical protein